MTTFPSEAEWHAAIKALLTAANARPYDFGVTVPSTVSAYTLLGVTDRFGGVRSMGGPSGTRGVRIMVAALGKAIDPANPLGNAREMRRRHDVALRDVRLTIGGVVTNPIEFETADPIDAEGDPLVSGSWFRGDTFYTCVI